MRKKKSKSKSSREQDPLFQLFEHYLMNRSYDDAAAFTKQLADDYMAYLDSTTAHLPMHLRNSVLEDLKMEAHEMLVKKMYGVVETEPVHNFGRVIEFDSSAHFKALLRSQRPKKREKVQD